MDAPERVKDLNGIVFESSILCKMTSDELAQANGCPNGFQDQKTIDVSLRTIRCLIADLCEQFKGGHPG